MSDFGVPKGIFTPSRRGMNVQHGTVSGYQTHLKLKSPTCDACKKANSEYRKRRASEKREKNAK